MHLLHTPTAAENRPKIASFAVFWLFIFTFGEHFLLVLRTQPRWLRPCRWRELPRSVCSEMTSRENAAKEPTNNALLDYVDSNVYLWISCWGYSSGLYFMQRSYTHKRTQTHIHTSITRLLVLIVRYKITFQRRLNHRRLACYRFNRIVWWKNETQRRIGCCKEQYRLSVSMLRHASMKPHVNRCIAFETTSRWQNQ